MGKVWQSRAAPAKNLRAFKKIELSCNETPGLPLFGCRHFHTDSGDHEMRTQQFAGLIVPCARAASAERTLMNER